MSVKISIRQKTSVKRRRRTEEDEIRFDNRDEMKWEEKKNGCQRPGNKNVMNKREKKKKKSNRNKRRGTEWIRDLTSTELRNERLWPKTKVFSPNKSSATEIFPKKHLENVPSDLYWRTISCPRNEDRTILERSFRTRSVKVNGRKKIFVHDVRNRSRSWVKLVNMN